MKELILKAVKYENHWLVVIVKQTHRRSEFGSNGNEFTASNGFRLASVSCPDIAYSRLTCFLRGSDTHSDNTPMYVDSMTTLQNIILAVKEYNKKFNGTLIIFEPIDLEQEFIIK